MAPRDEPTNASRLAGRSQSLPEGSPHSKDSTSLTQDGSAPLNEAGSSASSYLPRIPNRSSSLLDRHDPAIAALANYQFPARGDNSSSESSDGGPSSPKSPLPKVPPPKLSLCLDNIQDLEPMFLQPRLDTPPPSDQDEGASLTSVVVRAKAPLPKLAPLMIPPPTSDHTPAPSPEMTPTTNLDADDSVRAADADDPRPLLRRDSTDTIPQPRPSSRNGVRDASHALQSKTLSCALDAVLTEPNFGEFLSLDDDDIAEARPPTPVETTATDVVAPKTKSAHTPKSTRRVCFLPSNPPSFPAPSSPFDLKSPSRIPMPPLSRGLPHSPSALAQQAAAAAAFEVARIASRYRFDLVYIVNIWPKDLALKHDCTPWQSESPPRTPTQSSWTADNGLGPHGAIVHSGSLARMSPGSSVIARFLAAYGLATVEPPFYLSGSTHTKLINTPRWLEFRRDNVKPGDFSRGYGCSFYTGHIPVARRRSEDNWDADTEASDGNGHTTPRPRRPETAVRDCSLHNRGIVFVAYRKPRPDGSDLGSDSAELESLHRDAEALVEMILDFHTMQKRREQLEALRAARDADDQMQNSGDQPPRRLSQ